MGAVLEMKAILAVCAATLLSGCLPSLMPGGGGQSAQQTVTVAAESLTGPRLQVQIESRGANALLSPAAINNDVETWLAVDNISLSFRDGVLVASRGLGFDLMAADTRGTIAAFAGMGEDVYRRQMRYLTGEHHSTYLTAGCSMTSAGPETVDGQQLERLEEHCQARQHEFTNLFWRDPNGTVLRSRQWLSPEIGYIAVSLRR